MFYEISGPLSHAAYRKVQHRGPFNWDSWTTAYWKVHHFFKKSKICQKRSKISNAPLGDLIKISLVVVTIALRVHNLLSLLRQFNCCVELCRAHSVWGNEWLARSLYRSLRVEKQNSKFGEITPNNLQINSTTPVRVWTGRDHWRIQDLKLGGGGRGSSGIHKSQRALG